MTTYGNDGQSQAAKRCHRYEIVEWTFESGRSYTDPFHDVTLDAVVVDRQGRSLVVPGFWAGGSLWRVRFSPRDTGRYTWRTVCSDASDRDLHGREGLLTVHDYEGDNPLFGHGPLRMAASGRHLAHDDGTPFLWLGDTWWLGLTQRLSWPDDFQALAADRATKGFNVVQLLAGLPCDMGAHDPRGANEGGLAWEPGYTRINPAFFDWADQRIEALVQRGLVPCLFGAWSFYLLWMGVDKIKQHWRYLVARYGAYPVIWCLSGGGTMPFYVSEDKEGDRLTLRYGWSQVAHYLAALDPYHRPIALHPTPRQAARDELEAGVPYDLPMRHIGDLGRRLSERGAAPPDVSVALGFTGEICYPGMATAEQHDLQRVLFWVSVLSEAAGFTYGVNGIWQANTPGNLFGPSPNGRSWPGTLWREASRLSSSRQVGWGKRLLERYRWWEFARHPEWVTPHAEPEAPWLPHAAGIPGEVRLIYVPQPVAGAAQVNALEPGASYRITRLNPRDGTEQAWGTTQGAAAWAIPALPDENDWLLLLERQP